MNNAELFINLINKERQKAGNLSYKGRMAGLMDYLSELDVKELRKGNSFTGIMEFGEINVEFAISKN